MKSFIVAILLLLCFQAFSQTASFVGDRYRIQTSSGYVDIGSLNSGFGHFYTDRPSFYFDRKLVIKGSIEPYNINYLRIETDHGYVDVGPKNGGFSHFQTDRPRFYFNKKVMVNGSLSSYNQDLVLETSETPRITVLNTNGNVGIGTTIPGYKLDVNGSAAFRSTTYFYDATAYAYESSTGQYLHFRTSNGKGYVGMNSGNDLILQTNQGNVGIGTDNPTAKLAVDGEIKSEEVSVEIINGPDYVFEPDYELLSLKEIKDYISENKHLPEVPSAKEMERDGVELGDMSMLLLKKVEELTLHQIKLMEHIDQQNQRLLEQEARLKALETKE